MKASKQSRKAEKEAGPYNVKKTRRCPRTAAIASSACSVPDVHEELNLPHAIEMDLMTEVDIPQDWGTPASARKAAKSQTNLGRLMGSIDLSFSRVSRDSFSQLFKRKGNGPFSSHSPRYDEDGEYSTDPASHIPLTLLNTLVITNKIIPASDNTAESLQCLLSLQCPASSQWDLPFIRVRSSHWFDESRFGLRIRYAVYFGRLIFELISDGAIKHIVENFISVPCIVSALEQTKNHVHMFSKADSELLQLPSYRFSLAGLLKHTENTGYPMSESDPEGLKVSLYDYQRSSYQWMLDQELKSNGPNAHFWQEWKFADGQSLFYFPLGGEFRFDRPPATKGGLLCEEMGLGKTVEILALIKGNPMRHGNSHANIDSDVTISKATLIVVPPHLVHQWMSEITGKIAGCDDGSFTVMNAANISVNRLCETDVTCSVRDVRLVMLHEESNESGDMVERITPQGAWGEAIDLLPDRATKWVEIRDLPFGSKGKVYLGRFKRFCSDTHVEIAVSLLDVTYDHDVVVTTYADLKKSSAVFKRAHWHRIVLDECQEIKMATNQVATMCAKMSSTNRWMVSGTPLVSQIADLHGELNFLRIWPFSLPDRVDGFWELKIQSGYRRHDEMSLHLLHSLMSTVMMRHTKSQRYITNGEPLVILPARRVEFKGFIIADRGERYLYDFLASFAADALEDFMRESALEEDENNTTRWNSTPRYAQLRSFYSIMSRCITSASAIDLGAVDHLRRLLSSRRVQNIQRAIVNKDSDTMSIPLLTADDILARVSAAGAGTAGGMIWAADRDRANVKMAEEEATIRDELMLLSKKELMDRLQELELPLPMTWVKLNYIASTDGVSPVLLLHKPLAKKKKKIKSSSVCKNDENGLMFEDVDEVDEEVPDDIAEITATAEAASESSKALHRSIQVGAVLRIGAVESEDAEVHVHSVYDRWADPDNARGHPAVSAQLPGQVAPHRFDVDDIGFVSLTENCALGAIKRAPLFRHDFSSRKEPYVDLLISKHFSGVGRKNGGGKLHDEGFATLYKLMAGQAVVCPLCMVEAVRPTVTACVHVFCRDCIEDVILRADGGYGAKCPICRRAVHSENVMEVKMENVIDELTADQFEEDEEAQTIEQMRLKQGGESSSASGQFGQPDPDTASVDCTAHIMSPTGPREWNAGNTTFVVPEFDPSTRSELTSTVEMYRPVNNFRFHAVYQRNPNYPTIPPIALNLFLERQRRESMLGNAGYCSGRTTALVADMRDVQKDDPFAKFVVFSQYKESVVAVERELSHQGYKCQTITSRTAGPSTQTSLKVFHQDPACNVLLLTMSSSCNGLTLTVAQTVYLLEPSADAAAEAQALSRVHRIGQLHSVRCVVLYAQNTCEERLLALRKARKSLTEMLAADAALENIQADENEVNNMSRRPKNCRKKSKNIVASEQKILHSSSDSYFVGKNLCTIFGLTNSRKEERRNQSRLI